VDRPVAKGRRERHLELRADLVERLRRHEGRRLQLRSPLRHQRRRPSRRRGPLPLGILPGLVELFGDLDQGRVVQDRVVAQQLQRAVYVRRRPHERRLRLFASGRRRRAAAAGPLRELIEEELQLAAVALHLGQVERLNLVALLPQLQQEVRAPRRRCPIRSSGAALEQWLPQRAQRGRELGERLAARRAAEQSRSLRAALLQRLDHLLEPLVVHIRPVGMLIRFQLCLKLHGPSSHAPT
jgi:hypothetical protein